MHILDDEYEALKQEYADYAYIVSHDLNAPLRHVKEFSKLLLSSIEGDLDDDQKQYKYFIQTALSKLEEMQTALLAFSQIHTKTNPHVEIDMNQMILDIQDRFIEITKSTGASFTSSPLPYVFGDPAQLQTMFTHIIDNALKFHNGKNPPEISLSASKNTKNIEFEITDNGIGIEARFFQDVFKMFKTLNPEDYNGIGAGLTIARKIAKAHNGDIFLKPAENGTCVCIKLPISQS